MVLLIGESLSKFDKLHPRCNLNKERSDAAPVGAIQPLGCIDLSSLDRLCGNLIMVGLVPVFWFVWSVSARSYGWVCHGGIEPVGARAEGEKLLWRYRVISRQR